MITRSFQILLLLLAAGHALPARCPQGPASSAAALPRVGETWFSMRDGDQRYGAMHVVVQRRAEGSTELRTTSTRRIELFGTQQEHRTETTVVLDRDLRLLEFDTTHHTASGSQIVSGERTAAGLVVRSETADRTTETVLPTDAIAGLVIDVDLQWA